MLNDDQADYLRQMNATPPAEKCWCAWFKLGECPHCPPGLSAETRIKYECPSCHNYPPATNLMQPVTHRVGCAGANIR